MGELDHQLEAVGAGEPVGELLIPAGLEAFPDRFERAEPGEQEGGVRYLGQLARGDDEAAPEERDQPARERRAGQVVHRGLSTLPRDVERGAEPAEHLDHFLPRRRVLAHLAPVFRDATGGLIQQAVGNRRVKRRSAHSPSPVRSSRGMLCLSISRYNVVRSTPASRAAFDMFPPARDTRRPRYSCSKWATTRSLAV